MKKITLFSFFALIAALGFTGCFPEKAETALIYDGPTIVEFKNHTLGQIDTVLNRKGVYICTSQTDSSRSVNQNAIAYKATATTPNSLSCVATAGTTYQLKANTALAANARTTDTIYVQLVGAQRPSATVLTYKVRSTSTAAENVNYSFRPANARTVTIPANKSVGYILVDVLPALTTANTSVRIDLDLVGNDEIKANPNFDSFFLTIRRN